MERRDHLAPPQGSPAVSRSSSLVSAVTSAGFLFQRLAAPARLADRPALELPGQQLEPSAPHRAGIEAQQLCHAAVPTASAPQRLQAGVQPPQSLVEQADEQCPRRVGWSGRRGGRRQRAVAELTGAQLAGAPGGITGTVQEAAGEGFASQTAGACELAQGVLGGYAQQGVELADGEARAGLGRERLDGGEQRAVPGEAGLAVGPEAVGIEAG